MIASGGSMMDDGRKAAVLLTSVGVEGQRSYRKLLVQPPTLATTPGTYASTSAANRSSGSSARLISTTYDAAIVKWPNFFTPAINKTAERFDFRSRAQMLVRTVQEYVTALRCLATNFKFGTITENVIVDQLVEKAIHPKLLNRLLLEPELSLESTLPGFSSRKHDEGSQAFHGRERIKL